MFSKTTLALLGTLLGGILITGIGAGVAAVEYTSFDIDTTTLAQEVELATEELTYEMAADERVMIANSNCSVVFDEAVPEGVILMEITYAPKLSYLDFYVDHVYENDQPYSKLHLYTYYRGYENILLENKDLILKGLKDGVIYTFDDANYYIGEDSVKVVKINPADKSRLVDFDPDRYNSEYNYEFVD